MSFNITKESLRIYKLNKIKNPSIFSIICNSLHYKAYSEPILDYKNNSSERNSLISKLQVINNINDKDVLFDVPIVIL